MSLQLVDLPADRIEADVAAALFFSDERPVRGPAALLDWRLNGLLTDLLLQGRAQGKAGERVLVRSNGKILAAWVLFMGGGKWQGLGEETYRGLIRHLLLSCREAGFPSVALCLAPLAGMESADMERMVAEAAEGLGVLRPEFRLSLAG